MKDIDKIIVAFLFVQQVNKREELDSSDIVVDIHKVEDVELDEMWSYVGKKENQRWLWHAIDRDSGKIFAYAFGDRKDAVFLELKDLLAPFGIARFYSDGWGAYERHLPPEQHVAVKPTPKRSNARERFVRCSLPLDLPADALEGCKNAPRLRGQPIAHAAAAMEMRISVGLTSSCSRRSARTRNARTSALAIAWVQEAP